MALSGRTLFPYVALAGLAGAAVWASTLSRLPPADFTFVNGTEVESVDPARVTGSPEGRIITALFEGLCRPDPKTLQPLPGMAKSHEVSKDGLVYTYHIRPGAKWSDGTPLTAHDFAWSWQRLLHPETGSQYAFLLMECVVNAAKYRKGPQPGDPVDVELADRPNPLQPHPQGSLLPGKLVEISKPPKPKVPPEWEELKEERRKVLMEGALDKWELSWVYTVEINGKSRRFSRSPDAANVDAETCQRVLFDVDQVGFKALNSQGKPAAPTEPATIFEVTLISPTPYFKYLVQFYPLFPVQRTCVEKHGFPNWTKIENIVTNGPYRMEFRRARDRIRLRKSDAYWDAANVKIESADALAVESIATGLNMYLEGQVDWNPSAPSAIIPLLKDREDYHALESLTIAFYRVNVTRSAKDGKQGKPLDNVLVRRALNMAIDKRALCENLLRAGQKPSRSFVPPGLPDYEPALCGDFDVPKAQALLAEAGYAGGQGIGNIEILHNTGGEHGTLAEFIGGCWKKNLGVNVTYKALEWGSYLDTIEKLGYDVSRNGWIGDYPDPNTFLNLFLSDGDQNQTGWKNPRYDTLIEAAAREADPKRRLQHFHDAEQILMDELPVIPLYSAVNVNMVKPYVHGFYSNSQDIHPLRDLSIDLAAKKKMMAAGGRK